MDATCSGLPTSVEPDEARPHIIDMLDALRRQYESIRISRHYYVLLARKYGLSFSEIAEHVGMSASGVRYIAESNDLSELDLPLAAGGDQ